MDLDRITHPLRLVKGSYRRGSDKWCAMSAISYISGDMQHLLSEEVPAMTTSQVRSPRPLRSLLAGLVLVVALLSLTEVTTPTAHADAIDNAFLGTIKAKDINFASPQAAITAGHEVCDELDLGRQKSDVATDVMNNSGLDGYHAGFFVGVSIAAYCPRYRSAT
jgi:hypothetical protein